MQPFNHTVNTQETEVQAGSFIGKSGIYSLTIKALEYTEIVGKNAPNVGKKRYTFNLYTEFEGKTFIIFDAIKHLNFDGSTNRSFNMINCIASIAGVTGALSADGTANVNLKDGVKVINNVIPQLKDIQIDAFIEFTYSGYNGQLYEKKEIIEVFAPEGHRHAKATATEISTGTGFGVQYQILSSTAPFKVVEPITKELVEKWKTMKDRYQNTSIADINAFTGYAANDSGTASATTYADSTTANKGDFTEDDVPF